MEGGTTWAIRYFLVVVVGTRNNKYKRKHHRRKIDILFFAENV